MNLKKIDSNFLASEQIQVDELEQIKAEGIRSIICNRPDGEGADQPGHVEIETRARELGMSFSYIPVEKGMVQDEDVGRFSEAWETLPKPVLGYCRSGMRAVTLWSLSRANDLGISDVLAKTTAAGFDMSALNKRMLNGGKIPLDQPSLKHDIIIVGGGAAGIAVCSSLLKTSSRS